MSNHETALSAHSEIRFPKGGELLTGVQGALYGSSASAPAPSAPRLPRNLAVWGGGAALLTALVVSLVGEFVGFSLIVMFPFAIGAAAGFFAAHGVARQHADWLHSERRTDYRNLAIILGALGYLSTFVIGYISVVIQLESSGYQDVLSFLSFTDYLQVLVDTSDGVGRTGSSTIPVEGAGHFVLWLVECCAAAYGGYRGWNKAVKG